ncbi:hypothetical protein [Kitasatospora sp. NPDC059160]|uniref:hypothetical protein n=1 Tax=Kitasatospora sp. NPDC059160 TaxID=3346748 RepID=UPI00367CAE1E
MVRLTDRRRYLVPVVVVCPEFTPWQARVRIAAGEAPGLARAEHVDFVDIDSGHRPLATGHWPMVTRPAELVHLLDDMTPRG